MANLGRGAQNAQSRDEPPLEASKKKQIRRQEASWGHVAWDGAAGAGRRTQKGPDNRGSPRQPQRSRVTKITPRDATRVIVVCFFLNVFGNGCLRSQTDLALLGPPKSSDSRKLQLLQPRCAQSAGVGCIWPKLCFQRALDIPDAVEGKGGSGEETPCRGGATPTTRRKKAKTDDAGDDNMKTTRPRGFAIGTSAASERLAPARRRRP